MLFAGAARRTLCGVAAVLFVVAVAGVTIAWRTAGASASAVTGPHAAVLPAPATTTSTTVAPTTSTSTSTSTTVKPAPPTTVPKPRPTVPPTTKATTPATAPPTTRPAPVALPGNFTAEERCANSRQWVSQQGLNLPAGWGFRCPGQALENGTPRWGIACDNCAGDGQSWIAVDVGRIGSSDKALRYVIAHETCHAIDYTTLGISTEVGADLCAALHGAPRP